MVEKEALEQFARYFKNEMRFDFIQYEARSHPKECVGVLFTENAMDVCTEDHLEMPTRCIGGGLFHKDGSRWVLMWIWIHPFFRNRGALSSRWRELCSLFGDFAIEGPLSHSMKAFVCKQSGTHQLVKLTQ
ncbi:hypothetical protein AYI84_19430 [Shewanella algae]|nr:hypothetical protein AYI84_19430 [Shewanella algae]